MFKLRPVNTYSLETERDLPKSYAEAHERFLAWRTNKRRRSGVCKLDNNTTLEEGAQTNPNAPMPGVVEDCPESYAVKLHGTDVVTFYADGRVVLDTGGWQTHTTRDRMNRCGVRISMGTGVASVRHGERDVVFHDRMTLHPDGGATYSDGKRALDAEPARAKRRRLLARWRRFDAKGGKRPSPYVPFYWPNRGGGYVEGGNAWDVFAND